MKIQGIFLIFLAVALTGCMGQKKLFYSDYHGLTISGFQNGALTGKGFLEWGVALVPGGQTFTNYRIYTNGTLMVTNKAEVYYQVKVVSTGLSGYVAESGLRKNVLATGVMVNLQGSVRDVPALDSPGRQTVPFPVLLFVTNVEKSGGRDWFSAAVYHTPETCRLPGTDYIRVSNPYIDPADVSTNQSDVQAVRAVQLAVRSWQALTNAYNNGTNDPAVRLQEYQSALSNEMQALGSRIGALKEVNPVVLEYFSNTLAALLPIETVVTEETPVGGSEADGVMINDSGSVLTEPEDNP